MGIPEQVLGPGETLAALAEGACVLDTRSPSEFLAGHLPGAISFPLFSDEERARVGTLYKQVGKQAAVDEGLALVGPKMRDLVTRARAMFEGQSSRRPLVVHCCVPSAHAASVGETAPVRGLGRHDGHGQNRGASRLGAAGRTCH
jgi:tRNA 2-selenouridine synthase